jgi:oligopeptide/dipeptide ABC transporter ATP-binding protein
VSMPLMQVKDVSKRFGSRPSLTDRLFARLGGTVEPRTVYALDHVSLDLRKGEVLGLVGESGCGKSTLGRVMTGILSVSEGQVTLDGRPIMSGGRSPKKLGVRTQMIFQNPFSSLNPRIRIEQAISEGPVAHGLIKRKDAAAYAGEWLARVGLDPTYANRFPHQFSGGQRQRIAIARALAMKPDVVVCDEPVASLDVSIQAQIINLFMQLRAELGLTMLFISHDLGVVKHLCDRVAVMYLGRVVEIADTATLYSEPGHPYTRALLDSLPKLRLDEGDVTFHPIKGELPSPLSPPSGCHFRTRCPFAQEKCRVMAPPLLPASNGSRVACHFVDEILAADRLGLNSFVPVRQA